MQPLVELQNGTTHVVRGIISIFLFSYALQQFQGVVFERYFHY